MKIGSNFSSDISMLMSLINSDTIFLSTWNKEEDILPFSTSRVFEYNKMFESQINHYFFSDELEKLKENIIINNIEFEKNQISSQNFTFVSNGTTAALLSILTILKEQKSLRVLLLSPIYYIYIEILKILDVDIFALPANNINDEDILTNIKKEKINLVILNNPLFGTGICIQNRIIVDIQKSLLENNGCLLIDNIYNGLKWEGENFLNDFHLYKTICNNDNFIIMESLAKSLYLNGIKHCSLVSSEKWIEKLEKNSVYLCGSITAQQFNFIEKLYSKSEHQYIISQLNKNIEYVKENYNFLISLLSKSDFWLGDCKAYWESY